MQFVLSKDFVVGFIGERCIIGSGARQVSILDAKKYMPLLAAAEMWKSPHGKNEVIQALVLKGYDLEQVGSAIDFLLTQNHICISADGDGQGRYSRHLIYFNSWDGDGVGTQKRIESSSVVILGCGGIGNHISAHLAAAGVGKLTLVDDDVVEVSNLTRQTMFVEDDVGKRKTELLAGRLRKINSNVDVQILDLKITQPNDLGKIPFADVVVVGADEPRDLISWCNKDFVARRMPYLNVGYVGDIAVFGPFVIPGETGCFACRHLVATTEGQPRSVAMLVDSINFGSKAPSFGPLVGMSAALAASDVLRFLGKAVAPHALNRRIGLHSALLKLEFQECPRSEHCEVCAVC